MIRGRLPSGEWWKSQRSAASRIGTPASAHAPSIFSSAASSAAAPASPLPPIMFARPCRYPARVAVSRSFSVPTSRPPASGENA